MKRRLAWMPLIVAFALLPSLAGGQAESVFQIMKGQYPVGCGVVVQKTGREGVGLTAWHVVNGDSEFDSPADVPRFWIRYADGTAYSDNQCIRWDVSRDLALLKIWVPDAVPAVAIGEAERLNPDEPPVLIGYQGKAVELPSPKYVFEKTVWFDANGVQGDSGGGVFSDGCLLGIVSGGMLWVEGKHGGEWKMTRQDGRQVTWPLRIGRVEGFFPEPAKSLPVEAGR